MPTYLPPLRGVSYSVGYAEAATFAPLGRARLAFYEAWHPTLSAPLRFVDNTEDLTATLESTAPRDASAAVLFTGVRLNIAPPEESDSATSPEVSIDREGISGVLHAAFKTARGSLVPWVLIERIYMSDDLTAPAQLPVTTYYISSNRIGEVAAGVSASYADPANVSVPRLTFRRAEYSGLA